MSSVQVGKDKKVKIRKLELRFAAKKSFCLFLKVLLFAFSSYKFCLLVVVLLPN